MSKKQSTEIKAFFELLKSGLWERDMSDLSVFPLSDRSWEEVIKIAKDQTVLGVVFKGLQRLPKEFCPQKKYLMEMVVEVDRLENLNTKVNLVVKELFEKYNSIGVKPILQKGQGVALFYEYPLLRMCGDIDLYFDSEDEFIKIRDFLVSKGLAISKMPDNSDSFSIKGVEVEHHRDLIDISNPYKVFSIQSLVNKYGFKEVKLQDAKILIPDDVLNLVMLNAHIMKHTLGWGVGLRQVCDMARVYYKLSGRVDEKEIYEVYKELGILKWSRLLHCFLVDYMGLEEKYLPYKDKKCNSKPLFNIILNGGNFGYNLRGERQGVFKSKIKTLKSFLKKCVFSLKYSRKEYFWLVFKLVKGQVNN